MMPRRRSKTHGLEFRVRIHGRQISRTFADRKSGEAWVRDQKTAAERGGLGLPTGGTVAEAYASFLEDRGPSLKPRTRELYRSLWSTHLSDWAGRTLATIRPGHVDAWIGRMRSACADATVARAFSLLRAITSHSVRSGMIGESPCRGVQMRQVRAVREVRMFSQEETDRLLAASSGRMRAILEVALGTGLRRSELAALRWEWIDLERRVLTVPASVESGFCPKSGASREIPLDLPGFPDVVAAIRLASGVGLFEDVPWQRWAKELKQTGVPFRWHLCRHTFLSRLVLMGAPLRLVQEIAGHSSITTTERYSHLSPDRHSTLRVLLQGIQRRMPLVLTAVRRQ